MTNDRERISKEEYEALAAFRYAVRRFLHFSEDRAQAVGLTPQQHQALLAIKGFPQRDQITITELAERLQIRHHSAVGLTDRLVAQDLAAREHASGDHRQVFVRLTEHGAHVLEELTAAHRDELSLIGPPLTELFERLGRTESTPLNGADPHQAREE